MLFRAGIILLLAAAAIACKRDSQRIILIENETSEFRPNEAITIARATLEKQFGNLPVSLVPVLVSENGDTIASQIDDLNGDGSWDELFLVCSFSPESQLRVRLEFVEPHMAPVFPVRTSIWFARNQDDQLVNVSNAIRLKPAEGQAGGKFQFEGPGWENDLVGFRNYLDARNGMDIFGKLTGEMILDRAGISGDYHYMQAWGMDILRVGRSLGAGSLALVSDGKMHRVAPESDGDAVIITQGPLRSILRFNFNNWEIDGNIYNLVHEVSIHAGTWFYESKVWFPGQSDELIIGAGITTIDLGDKEGQLMYSDEGVVTVATHAAQSYDFEQLGMAIMLPGDYYAGLEKLGPEPEINNSYLVKMKTKRDNPVVFRFYSAWEKSDPRFADEDYFHRFLQAEANRLQNPVKVSFE
jgi:hypothetical protein